MREFRSRNRDIFPRFATAAADAAATNKRYMCDVEVRVGANDKASHAIKINVKNESYEYELQAQRDHKMVHKNSG